MDSSIIKLLNDYKVNDNCHTHVTVFNPKAKYNLSRDHIDYFWKEYGKLIYVNPEAIVGIAEKPQRYIPVMVDVDIKIEKKFDEISQIYTEEHVKKICGIYQNCLMEIVADCTNEHVICLVLEKPPYYESKGSKTYIKNGFHLHFPYIFLDKMDHEVHLFPRIIKAVKEEKVFEDLNIGESEKLIDKTYNKHWLLYGSKKDKDMDPYVFTKCYDHNIEEITLKKALKNYKIYNSEEKALKIKEKEKYYLPRILSIIPFGRKNMEISSSLSSPFSIICEKERKSEKQTYTTKENIEIATKLLPLLSDQRAQDRNEWMNIGWVLYNISKGKQEGLNLWLEFSKRCPDSFSETCCIYEWNKMTRTNMTIGTLKYFASVDNPEEYEKFRYEQTQKFIRDSVDKSHYSIAQALYSQNRENFVCSSIKNKVWYFFEGHTWKISEEGVDLRKKISTELSKKYADLGKEFFHKMGESQDEGEKALFSQKVASVNKLMRNLENSSFKASIMKECMDIFYDEFFEKKLNSNKDIIAFQNGIYDLKQHTFRSGKPEDYISLKLAIDYEEYEEYDESVSDIHDFLNKVFPDKSIRKYWLDTTSEMFVGGNHRKHVYVYTDDRGNNGKSITVSFLEKIFGELFVKIKTGVMTGKRGGSGSTDPELVRAISGARIAVVQETDKKDKMNNALMKELSGNCDSMWARDLFEKGKDTKEKIPMCKLIIVCNKPPEIPYDDKASWNRIKVIPFESVFVDEDELPDTWEQQLKEKKFLNDPEFSSKIPYLVKALAWVLLQHYKNNNKNYYEPDKVRLATNIYRKRNDIYKQFIEENIIESKKEVLSIAELYNSFKIWFKDSLPNNSVPTKSDVKEYFTSCWGESGKGIKWKGYRIRTISDDESNEDSDENNDNNGYLTD